MPQCTLLNLTKRRGLPLELDKTEVQIGRKGGHYAIRSRRYCQNQENTPLWKQTMGTNKSRS